jgi:dTDP-4-amino-4,6-dideoxygalactose transaminase
VQKPVCQVPFFRPQIADAEVEEVTECLRSGWLTTGPRVRRFEEEFAAAVGARHAVAVNSCTAALHLALEALDVRQGYGVLVPTMTFAATAEVVRYFGAVPLLVDCEPDTLNMCLADAAAKIEAVREGITALDPATPIVGIMPVHVGGYMMDMEEVSEFAIAHGLWVVEDAAHTLPAAFRSRDGNFRVCGASTADATCFSFYANKTITTGEGGMVVTENAALAARVRQMSLHGLSSDAWNRYSDSGRWDYQIVAPGYKYNLTDVAASIGIHQLRRAEEMRRLRQDIAETYISAFADVEEVELPLGNPDRLHAWHLFPLRLRLDRLTCTRAEFMEMMRDRSIGCSVHWRPLHLHPYYQDAAWWTPRDLPVATEVWERLVSLPIFQGMTAAEVHAVCDAVRSVCALSRRSRVVAPQRAPGAL